MEDEKIEKMKAKRWKVASELLSTENTYVSNINLLLEVFYKPMSEHAKAPEDKRTISAEDVKQLFGSIKVIHGLNTQLLQSLQERLSIQEEDKQADVMIGDIFLQFVVYFKTYTTYCHDYEQSLETLKRCRENPDFESYFLGLHDKKLIGEQSIKQFLILPVQRIPRYKMLLHELLKSTWETHPDYQNLVNSLEQISKIAQFVEDAQDRFENIKKIVEIQNELRTDKKATQIKLLEPNRIYLTEINLDVLDSAEVIVNNTPRPRKIILFNDIILICKITLANNSRDKSKKKKENLKVKRLVDITDISALHKSSFDRPTLVITIPSAIITFYFDTEQKRDDWHEHISNCEKTISQNANQRRDLTHSSGSLSSSSSSSSSPSALKLKKSKKTKKHNTISGDEVQVLNPLHLLQSSDKPKKTVKVAVPLLATDDLKKSTSLDSLSDVSPRFTNSKKQRSRTLLFSPRDP